MSRYSFYTPDMEQELREAAPLDLKKAQHFSLIFGVSHMSIIAKCRSLGVEYVSQPKPEPKRAGVPTKADLIEMIELEVGLKPSGDVTFSSEALQCILKALRKGK